MKHIVVAITGASGSIYGLRLVEELLRRKIKVTFLVSDAGRAVLRFETGVDLPSDPAAAQALLRGHFACESLHYYAADDFFAPAASGSSAPDAMVVVPASMGTVGRIAAGTSNSLIERVADVLLKERRRLIIVPRETPFNLIHLRNLVTLSEAGAIVLPPSPAFYHRPATLDDLVNFVVGKILDSLGFDHDLFPRWGDQA